MNARDQYIAAHKCRMEESQTCCAMVGHAQDVCVIRYSARLPVAAIDTGLVMRVIEPLWTKKPETAARLRGRIESILDWSRVHGYRSGENPARWKGHLDHLLPARNKVQKVEHHAALPYVEIGSFMTDLRQIDSVPARALEFDDSDGGTHRRGHRRDMVGDRFRAIRCGRFPEKG